MRASIRGRDELAETVQTALSLRTKKEAEYVVNAVIMSLEAMKAKNTLSGIIEYRDTFGSKHETRYCYRFKSGPTEADPAPRDFYVDGPSSYNRAT
jgi:hypothetical protein